MTTPHPRLLCLSLLLAACPGDSGTSTDGGTTSGSTGPVTTDSATGSTSPTSPAPPTSST